MAAADSHNSLRQLTPLIIGGSGFGNQLSLDPTSIPLVSILEEAFSSGVRAIDTSPYYDPSEILLGDALNDPLLALKYPRHSYSILTKCGRVTANHLDYSEKAIKASVTRSLGRFKTDYLDVVFAHDVELVSTREALEAVRVLSELREVGSIRHVGISGYEIEVLEQLVLSAKRLGYPIEVVQCWAQLTLQNSRLEDSGALNRFREAGVKAFCCSSPLACGLLRSQSVPVGVLGDWHPAPQGLRARAQEAARWVSSRGEDLASLALRHAMFRAQQSSTPEMLVTTISGIASLEELRMNMKIACETLGVDCLSMYNRNLPSSHSPALWNKAREEKDDALCSGVREILADWVDWDFSKKTGHERAIVEVVPSQAKAPIVNIVPVEELQEVQARL